ncbi:unnamed protein product [Darwinula stevensoni]|uniref:Uncharacterized protein n=1 Tax=Darwinula stevensoni TaxID=69355 RepID=A0A7R8XCE1_9CRUS|nr:unnamed protein product [Darwinula stevensoni]CAG0892467.1 unnamed protein product [Darwinula stevensoni]
MEEDKMVASGKVLVLAIIAVTVMEAHGSCWDDWSRCSDWSSGLTGIAWQDCPTRCKCKGFAGGSCEEKDSTLSHLERFAVDSLRLLGKSCNEIKEQFRIRFIKPGPTDKDIRGDVTEFPFDIWVLDEAPRSFLLGGVPAVIHLRPGVKTKEIKFTLHGFLLHHFWYPEEWNSFFPQRIYTQIGDKIIWDSVRHTLLANSTTYECRLYHPRRSYAMWYRETDNVSGASKTRLRRVGNVPQSNDTQSRRSGASAECIPERPARRSGARIQDPCPRSLRRILAAIARNIPAKTVKMVRYLTAPPNTLRRGGLCTRWKRRAMRCALGRIAWNRTEVLSYFSGRDEGI